MAVVSITPCLAHALKKCAQSANFQFDTKSPSDFGESRYPGALLPVLENFRPAFSPDPTDCPWVSEDAVEAAIHSSKFGSVNHHP